MEGTVVVERVLLPHRQKLHSHFCIQSHAGGEALEQYHIHEQGEGCGGGAQVLPYYRNRCKNCVGQIVESHPSRPLL